jgi:predicted kinase
MPIPALLIITGHPATGKTTLARALASELSLPLLSKDTLKETIFDTLGWSDRSWARQVGGAAIALLYATAETMLAAGVPLILESNFRADLDTTRMARLREVTAFHPIQLRCVASGEVMAERYLRRITAGQRHAGHCETTGEDDLRMMRELGHVDPLGLDGPLLTLDTTDPAAVDLAAVTRWTRTMMAAPTR